MYVVNDRFEKIKYCALNRLISLNCFERIRGIGTLMTFKFLTVSPLNFVDNRGNKINIYMYQLKPGKKTNAVMRN